MNRKDYIDKTAKYLARFVEEVKSYNDSTLYDINIHAENALIPILNAVFDLKLKNANAFSKKNFPAVDLVDFDNRISFQVTATPSLSKIKDTLVKFNNHSLQDKFDTLYIFILTQKDDNYNDKVIQEAKPSSIEFSVDEHIMDISDLRRKITYIQSLEKLQYISRICEHEFSDAQINLRKNKYTSGYLRTKSEHLYGNLLEISFPDSLYVADLFIDSDAAKDRINDWRMSKGWRKKSRFKQGELLRSEMIEKKVFDSEWILRENKIYTFRNLHDRREGLSQFIDEGTIEVIRSSDYYYTTEAHLSNFKNLLRACLIQLCRNKEMEWYKNDEILRFKNNRDMPNQKQLKWKGKNVATKTVIFEIMSKTKGHIICFRSMAFKPSFENYGDKWYLIVNPTWSFTNPGGYSKSQYESGYMSGLKRQENNNAVYYQFKFFAYHLTYQDLFTPPYQFLKIHASKPFDFVPSIDDSKWVPPKEFDPKNELEKEIVVDKELNQTFFDNVA